MLLLPLAAGLLWADPAARLDAFLKAHPAFVATVDVASGGSPLGKGTLRIVRNQRLRFDAKGPDFDYSLSSTEVEYLEMERTSRTYDQRPSTGGFGLYDSRISSVPGLLPAFLMRASTAAILGREKRTIRPVAGGDEIKTTVQTQRGSIELRLVVDPKGQPLSFAQGPLTWRVTSFKDVAPDLAPFRIVPPNGYLPHALPDLPSPLPIGAAAPLAGWQQGGKTIDLGTAQRGKPRLLAVLAADSPPSEAARPVLKTLAASMPVYLIGPGGISDPSGKLLKRLSPPGAPMFYLVDGAGKVAKLWLGFDPAKANDWLAEVREAAK